MVIERQYIGARYVPKFMGAYSATTQYEALSVVDDGYGTSYISKKPTPPNTPLTNAEYWAVYGASSGAILDLQGRMTSAENDINVIKGSILSIGGQISDIDNEVEDVKELLNDVGRMWYIGDSFVGYTVNWCNQLDSMLGKTDSIVTYENGIGYNDPGADSNQKLYEKISAQPVHNDVDVVVVVAGCNDCGVSAAGDLGTYRTAVRNAINQIKLKAPNARKYLFAFNGTFVQPSSTLWADASQYIGDVYTIIRDEVTRHGKCAFLRSVAHQLQFTTLIYSDGVHPDPRGQQLIAQCINSYLAGSETTTKFRKAVTPFIFEMCDMDNVIIQLPGNQDIDISPAINITTGTINTLGIINAPYFPRYNGLVKFIVSRIQCTKTDNSVVNLDGASTILFYPNGAIGLFEVIRDVPDVKSVRISLAGAPCVIDPFEPLHALNNMLDY